MGKRLLVFMDDMNMPKVAGGERWREGAGTGGLCCRLCVPVNACLLLCMVRTARRPWVATEGRAFLLTERALLLQIYRACVCMRVLREPSFG
jgi:hypothetical protein